MKNKRFKKYVIKYTLEFIVIVLGISVSFWVNQVAVEKNENKERLKKIQNILKSIQLESNKNYFNKYSEVLVENKLNNQKKYFGRTKDLTPVVFESDSCKFGETVNIKITSFANNSLFGFHKINKIKAA